MKFVFKPLLLVVTAFNVFLFVSLFGNRGEGGPALASLVSAQTESNYRLSDLNILRRVVNQIERDYVDPQRVKPQEMLDKALERIERDIPDIMFEPSTDRSSMLVTVNDSKETIVTPPVDSLDAMVSVLRTALTVVERHLHTDMPLQEVEYSAVNGFLSTLDPHSILMPPEAARDMDVAIQGEFGGLGITISVRGEENILTVINTLPDTPAARGGLLAGDQIVQIEEESTINMNINDAVSKLRGPVGTSVSIMINRQGWDAPRPYTLRRETIRIDSIEKAYLGQGIGYVHIKTFQQTTSRDLDSALASFRSDNGPIKGLVLDLRNNPGGPLQQAIEVSDRFLESGTIVLTETANPSDLEEYRAQARNTEDPYPIVVVVDSESASASEIVAGALKNNGRAVIVGEQTFGKGSVQNLYPYADDSKLKLTMARYLTPGRKWIQSVGITPDVRLVPVYFDQRSTFFYSTGHIFREKDLDSHFEESPDAGKGDKVTETIRFFSERDFKNLLVGLDDSDTPKKEEIKEPAKPDPTQDYQVQFARDMILKAGKPERESMLKASGSFLKAQKEAREQEIQKQFAAMGIDWSEGRSNNTQLQVQAKLGQSDVLTAGDKVSMSITVTNTGRAPAFQVRALTDSELGTFKDLEFLFGRIEPGASRTYTREVKVPSSLFSLATPLKVKLFEAAEKEAGVQEVMVRVDELPQPSFAYSLVVVDDGSGKSKGNGDGKVQRGEDIDLVLLMKNNGKGNGKRVMAKLQNESGKYVYLRQGTANLKEVPAGGWLEGRFSFQVREGFSEKAIDFDFLSGDSGYMRRPKDVVTVPVEPASAAAPVVSASQALVKAKGTGSVEIRGGSLPDAGVFARVMPGTILQSTGKIPGWVRVQVPWKEGVVTGWMAEKSVEAGSGVVAEASAFEPVFNRVPPEISVPVARYELPNSETSLDLKGEIWDDEGAELLYVFVNNHKRYLHQVAAGELKAGANNGKVVAFNTKVPLEEGVNTVEIYTRDSRQMQSMEVFQVFRTPSTVPQANNDNPTSRAR